MNSKNHLFQGVDLDNGHCLQNIYTTRSQETIHEWLLKLNNNLNEEGVVFYPEKP